jgi:hypothetical protein
MTAKYFIVLDQINGDIKSRPAEAVISENASAFAAKTKTSQIVLAQADSEEQAERFLSLLKHGAAA